MLARHDSKQTNWHVVAKKGNTEVWILLQEWATKNLVTEELNVEWLISKCDTDQTIWQLAAEHGNTGLLEKLWE